MIAQIKIKNYFNSMGTPQQENGIVGDEAKRTRHSSPQTGQ